MPWIGGKDNPIMRREPPLLLMHRQRYVDGQASGEGAFILHGKGLSAGRVPKKTVPAFLLEPSTASEAYNLALRGAPPFGAAHPVVQFVRIQRQDNGFSLAFRSLDCAVARMLELFLADNGLAGLPLILLGAAVEWLRHLPHNRFHWEGRGSGKGRVSRLSPKWVKIGSKGRRSWERWE